VHYPDQPLEVERGVSHQTGATYAQGGQYVSGAGQTYTTTTVVQPAEKIVYTTNTNVPVSNAAYSTGGQYTTTYENVPSNAVYSTSPQYTYETGRQYATTYETVPAGYVVNESGSRVGGQQY
jgi:hypothetical protein